MQLNGSVINGLTIRRVYLSAALLVVTTAVIGFWPTYFGPLFRGSVHAPLVIHLHAVVYVSWLVLFVAQVVLAATNRVRLHVWLGKWIMAYSVVMVIAGLMAMAEGLGRDLRPATYSVRSVGFSE